ncbi:MAG: hypothetical protein SGJ26_03220 [Nitrospirota bacterium]|nr:hypothetical protein [Nitrospirota bacterium]
MQGKIDRPNIELSLNSEGLKVTWGPIQGPWGIFNEVMVANPENVTITEWWLIVGTKAKLHQPDEDDEPTRGEIVSQSVGAKTEMTIPRYLLPVKQHIFAQVIGFFKSRTKTGDEFIEGIYSDKARVKT